MPISRTVPLRPARPVGADPGRLRTGVLAGFLGFALAIAAVDPGTALDATARTPVPEKGYRSGRDALRSGVRDYNAGDKLGAVGATGWATGPHLHFEFKVRGEHKDPMIIARASESVQLSPNALAQYRHKATTVAQRLDMAGQMQTAGASTGPRFE